MKESQSQDIKQIIGQNIKNLRKKNNMSQQTLGDIVGYTDKAVSKWEIGKSQPEIEVLMKIADTFNVTVDYFLHQNSEENIEQYITSKAKDHNHLLSTLLLILVVWVIASIAFVYTYQDVNNIANSVMFFIWALPVSAAVLTYSYRYKERRTMSVFLSILLWTSLIAAYFQFYVNGLNLFLIFTIGIPAQIAIFVWSKIIKVK